MWEKSGQSAPSGGEDVNDFKTRWEKSGKMITAESAFHISVWTFHQVLWGEGSTWTVPSYITAGNSWKTSIAFMWPRWGNRFTGSCASLWLSYSYRPVFKATVLTVTGQQLKVQGGLCPECSVLTSVAQCVHVCVCVWPVWCCHWGRQSRRSRSRAGWWLETSSPSVWEQEDQESQRWMRTKIRNTRNISLTFTFCREKNPSKKTKNQSFVILLSEPGVSPQPGHVFHPILHRLAVGQRRPVQPGPKTRQAEAYHNKSTDRRL